MLCFNSFLSALNQILRWSWPLRSFVCLKDLLLLWHFYLGDKKLSRDKSHKKYSLYSIFNPITSLVIPENFLFSLVRGRLKQLYLPRKVKLVYLPMIFLMISDWIQNGIKLHIYYLLWNQNRTGNFQGIFCSSLISL